MNDDDYDQVFFGGKGASKGKARTTGKGKGQGRRNPTGRDGEVMECDAYLPTGGECGSEEHLRANCPHRRQRAHLAATNQPSSFSIGPHDEILN